MKTLTSLFHPSVLQRLAFSALVVAQMLTSQPASAASGMNLVSLAQQAVLPAEASTTTKEESGLVVPEEPLTVQDVLLHVCEERGYGEDCAKTLLGMLWKESSNRSTVIGDNGRARGYFQIHYKLHKIPVACAEDLICSANWTLDYLESNSYPKYVKYAVQCHNGCGANNGYAEKSLRLGRYFWDKPLQINQAAPIEIAMK